MALFADLPEQDRQHKQEIQAHQEAERQRVLALCDTIQIAVARGQHDRANALLQEMHAIFGAALSRRRCSPFAGRRMDDVRATLTNGVRS